MNLRLGIYEIFSRIVPGGVYIAAMIQFLAVLNLITFDWQSLEEIPLIVSLALVVVAYIFGEALDPFSYIWLRIFDRKGMSHQALAEFKQRHQEDWDIAIEDKDWPTLLAFIRTENLELAGEIERYNAISIMLRNVSLGLALMMVNWLVQYAITRNILDVIAAVILFFLSALIVRESAKFRRWFYHSIFETILAYRLDLEKIIKPTRDGAKQRSGEKQSQQKKENTDTPTDLR